MNGVLTSLALVLVFVLIGGYFSASELALVSLRDSQVDRLPGKRGDRVRKLRFDSNRFLASVQVGVTLAGFFASAYGGSTLSEPFGELLEEVEETPRRSVGAETLPHLRRADAAVRQHPRYPARAS